MTMPEHISKEMRVHNGKGFSKAAAVVSDARPGRVTCCEHLQQLGHELSQAALAQAGGCPVCVRSERERGRVLQLRHGRQLRQPLEQDQQQRVARRRHSLAHRPSSMLQQSDLAAKDMQKKHLQASAQEHLERIGTANEVMVRFGVTAGEMQEPFASSMTVC